MILCDSEIKDYVSKGIIRVSSFDESLINPASLDVRLGRHYTKTIPKDYGWYNLKTHEFIGRAPGYGDRYDSNNKNFWVVNPARKDTFESVSFEAAEYTLFPGEMILASMLEKVTLPDFITAKLHGKSSLGRLGLGNSEVAGVVDAGWDGVLVMELFNFADYAIKLTSGMKIGHLIFHSHEPADKPYGITGRYQNQTGATSGSQGV